MENISSSFCLPCVAAASIIIHLYHLEKFASPIPNKDMSTFKKEQTREEKRFYAVEICEMYAKMFCAHLSCSRLVGQSDF